MPKSILVLLASARHESDTLRLVQTVFPEQTVTVLNLLDYIITPYRYNHQYLEEDGFLTVIDHVLRHEIIIFATPVYWYAMSGLMKTFFDRLTDLSTIHKKMGRELAGKLTSLLAIGSDQKLPPGFEVPFQLTSSYFAMDFRGYLYYSQKHPKADFQHQAQDFIRKLL